MIRIIDIVKLCLNCTRYNTIAELKLVKGDDKPLVNLPLTEFLNKYANVIVEAFRIIYREENGSYLLIFYADFERSND